MSEYGSSPIDHVYDVQGEGHFGYGNTEADSNSNFDPQVSCPTNEHYEDHRQFSPNAGPSRTDFYGTPYEGDQDGYFDRGAILHQRNNQEGQNTRLTYDNRGARQYVQLDLAFRTQPQPAPYANQPSSPYSAQPEPSHTQGPTTYPDTFTHVQHAGASGQHDTIATTTLSPPSSFVPSPYLNQQPAQHQAQYFQAQEHPEDVLAHYLRNKRVKCCFPGCEATFGRLPEFTRHYDTTHAEEKPEFYCPVLNCSRSEDRPFTREDKLSDHMRQKHGRGA